MKRYFWLILSLVAGSFLMQGFQCASPEMTTGNIAAKNQDWAKAEASFEKELSKNPSNAEAWIKLAEARYFSGQIKKAAETIVESDKHITDQLFKLQANKFKNTLWTERFNLAINQYNRYTDVQNKKSLDSALENLDIAIKIRPAMPSLYSLKGGIMEILMDTAKAIESYSKYAELVDGAVNLARDKGLFVNMKRDEVLKALGKPADSSSYRVPDGGDSLTTDEFKIDGKEVYLFSYEKDKEMIVYGWKVDPPKDWLPGEREQPASISTAPFASLAAIYFERREYDKSLKNVQKITLLDPSNIEANSFMASIYEAMGSKDEAANYIKSLVDKQPANKILRAQYGDILLKLERYDEAIAQYEQALKIAPDFSDVFKTLGAAYKNKAVKIQGEQMKKSEADKNYKIDTKEYFPLLEKSAQYFEDSRKHSKDDIFVLGELANIYDVLDQKARLTSVLTDLENQESTIEPNKKEAYYYTLLKIYEKLNLNDKSAQVQKKIEALNKQ